MHAWRCRWRHPGTRLCYLNLAGRVLPAQPCHVWTAVAVPADIFLWAAASPMNEKDIYAVCRTCWVPDLRGGSHGSSVFVRDTTLVAVMHGRLSSSRPTSLRDRVT